MLVGMLPCIVPNLARSVEVESKDYFDGVASQWDQMRKQFFSDAVRDKALAVAAVESGRLAADIGAGTGFVTQGLLAKGLQVVAVDQSEEMLMAMRHKFGHGAGMEYRLGAAEHLPLDDAVVDYAFANMYLQMVRILKPGGCLVITDLDSHTHEFLREEQHDRWMGFDRADVRQWFEDAGLHGVDVDCVGENCCASSACGEQAAVSIFVASGRK
jgi:ubiquinone/menaquinone biosynthesis C-methylase UbiE